MNAVCSWPEMKSRRGRHLDNIKNFYIASFSHRVIVYKGLLTAVSLEKFYRDLANPEYETAICLYHERYSTNTFPTWPLASHSAFSRIMEKSTPFAETATGCTLAKSELVAKLGQGCRTPEADHPAWRIGFGQPR